MDIKVKTLLVISLSALFVTGCSTTNTNGRAAFGQQVATDDSGQKGVTHTHNGVAHTHPLPQGGLSHSHNYNTGSASANTNPATCAPCRSGTTRAPVVTVPAVQGGGTQNNANSHAHNGRRHSHPLPASGTNHQHNQEQQTQNNNNTTYYDYTGGSSTGNTGSNYYNYGGSKGNASTSGVAHSHGSKSHTHPLPASGTNHSHNQGSTSIGSTFGGGGGTSNTGAGGCNTASGRYYVVKRSEGIYRAAVNSGVKQADIIRLNNLPIGATIHPGQCLKVR